MCVGESDSAVVGFSSPIKVDSAPKKALHSAALLFLKKQKKTNISHVSDIVYHLIFNKTLDYLLINEWTVMGVPVLAKA